MKIFTVCTPKGGVGKTTISALLTTGFAHQGRRVHAIDIDPSENFRNWASTSLLASSIQLDIHAAMRNRFRLEKLAPAGTEIVIVDTPPALIATPGYVAAQSTAILIPIGASEWEDIAVQQLLPIIRRIRALRERKLDVFIIPNRIDGRSKDLNKKYQHLNDICDGLKVAPTIRDRIAYQRLINLEFFAEIRDLSNWILHNVE